MRACLVLLITLPPLAPPTPGPQVEWELVNDTDTAGMYLMVSDGRDLHPSLIDGVVGVSRDNGYSWRFANLVPRGNASKFSARQKENRAKFVAIFLKIVGWVERIPLIIVDFRGVFECPICLNVPKFE